MLTASELWLDRHIFNESELALFPECMLQCARKALDTAGIVREAILRQRHGEAPELQLLELRLAYPGRVHVHIAFLCEIALAGASLT